MMKMGMETPGSLISVIHACFVYLFKSIFFNYWDVLILLLSHKNKNSKEVPSIPARYPRELLGTVLSTF